MFGNSRARFSLVTLFSVDVGIRRGLRLPKPLRQS